MSKFLHSILEKTLNSHAAKIERVKISFALLIDRALVSKGMSKTELAKELSVSQPQITKILRGDQNLTIQTMCNIARALDCELQIQLVNLNERQEWVAAKTHKIIKDNDNRAIKATNNPPTWAKAS